MKYPEEIEQMNAIAAALTTLMRVALKDDTATVEYDAEADALVQHCGVHKVCKRVSTECTSATAAVRDFIDRCCWN